MAHPIREQIACGAMCRHLRTKGMYVLGEDGPPPELPHPPGTAVHWCVLSGWAMGPDLSPANPERCAREAGRDCFEPEATA